MPTTYFNLYKLTVEPKENSPYTSFEEMLNNNPSRPTVLAKNKNPFKLDGRVRKDGSLYYGTFCLIQKNELPTKAYFDKEPEQILGDEDDGGLGHYTSFIYDSTNDVIAIQNNRNGVNANGIASYFRRNYQVREIELELIINPDKIEQLQKMTKITSFIISIARPENASFATTGRNASFSEINAIADATNANTLQLNISVGYDRGSSLKRPSIFSYVRNLLSPNQPLDVKKIEVKGKENEDDNTETLDLITNKVSIPVTYRSPRTINPRFLIGIIKKAIEEYTSIKPKIDRAYKVKRRS